MSLLGLAVLGARSSVPADRVSWLTCKKKVVVEKRKHRYAPFATLIAQYAVLYVWWLQVLQATMQHLQSQVSSR
jgi:hypothetical protein